MLFTKDIWHFFRIFVYGKRIKIIVLKNYRMNRRCFFDVGDALFAVEQINGHNFVYDCGGQKMSLVENAIKKAFKKGDEIEAVFISHYDADHINGIFFLLNHCNVKRLILPMMTNAIKLILLILQNYKGGLDEFIIDPEEYVRKISQKTKVIFVNENIEHPFDSENVRDISFDELSQLPQNRNWIKSGTRITDNTLLFWVYIPMCIVTLTNKQEVDFIAKLHDLLGLPVPTGKVDVKQFWKDHKLYGGGRDKTSDKVHILNKIKTAIQAIIPDLDDKGINAASQTLYSGPCCHSKPIRIGCLYMGDFDAKENWDKLKPVYENYQKNVRIVQVPHHGSENSFTDEIIGVNTLAVVSVNLKSKIAIGETITRIANRNGIPLMTGSRGDIEIECHNFIALVSVASAGNLVE